MELCSWLEEKRSDFRFSFFAFRLVHINTGAPSATLPRSDRRNSQRSLPTWTLSHSQNPQNYLGVSRRMSSIPLSPGPRHPAHAEPFPNPTQPRPATNLMLPRCSLPTPSDPRPMSPRLGPVPRRYRLWHLAQPCRLSSSAPPPRLCPCSSRARALSTVTLSTVPSRKSAYVARLFPYRILFSRVPETLPPRRDTRVLALDHHHPTTTHWTRRQRR
ncbi:hypothetical protein EXIGLDRAFT_459261 [Exidia glandulosa HHB12029]|uniref:Uncharacterized protein n=1 Tax=Exidia glandulosa HHB12029 TaxID=1314781 RepID=A0A165PQA9_EXIGL|nr:hypothetical protein EXIGLDRAFT_459261 [Exidia glandulosa HHB12029]